MQSSTEATSTTPPVTAPRVLTIDVEEYFHIEAAYTAVGPTRWNDWPSRVEASVDLLLALFIRALAPLAAERAEEKRRRMVPR